MRVILALLLMTTSALGQGLRDGDVMFDQPGLTRALSGQVIEYYDGSFSTYRADGSYVYRYGPGDVPHRGVYAVGDGGEVCVTFENGRARCDTFVMGGARMVLVIANGTRYPVRSVSPAD